MNNPAERMTPTFRNQRRIGQNGRIMTSDPEVNLVSYTSQRERNKISRNDSKQSRWEWNLLGGIFFYGVFSILAHLAALQEFMGGLRSKGILTFMGFNDVIMIIIYVSITVHYLRILRVVCVAHSIITLLYLFYASSALWACVPLVEMPCVDKTGIKLSDSQELYFYRMDGLDPICTIPGEPCHNGFSWASMFVLLLCLLAEAIAMDLWIGVKVVRDLIRDTVIINDTSAIAEGTRGYGSGYGVVMNPATGTQSVSFLSSIGNNASSDKKLKKDFEFDDYNNKYIQDNDVEEESADVQFSEVHEYLDQSRIF